MSDIFGILHVGRGALLTQQTAIEVTGHNIANANTPGFSRQRVRMETGETLTRQPGLIGTGVRASEIQRVYDRFLGVQINNENQELGRWEAQKNALERVEMAFDEPSEYGVSRLLSEFWNAWQELANNPSGYAERISLVSKSENLTDRFNTIVSDLGQIQKEIDESIRGGVQQINLITERIAGLNGRISQAEAEGQNANDFRDERDRLLKELSSMVDFTSVEGDDGKVMVFLYEGQSLVESVSSRELATQLNASGHREVLWVDEGGNTTNITGSLSGGMLKGWVEARDVVISDYLARLDDLAAGIVNEVNSVHRNGYGLSIDPATVDPITNPEGDYYTNVDFFVGTSASDMVINPDIAGDVSLIAAAQDADALPGDNRNALEMAGLQSTLTMSGPPSTATFSDFYAALLGDVGSAVQQADISVSHQSDTLAQLDNYRESVSGVSLDEEMVNLIKFQHAYEAAAKLISTVDELLESLIGMV